MDERVVAWGLAVVSAAALAVFGHAPARKPLHWAFKPLTVVLIGLALIELAPPSELRRTVVVALGFSVVGDVLLMAPRRYFVFGLAAFALALLTYAVGFSLAVPFAVGALVWLPAAVAVGAGIVASLWRHLGKLRPAVVVYATLMAFLLWSVIARASVLGLASPSARWGLVGGLLFVSGDTLLAWRRFGGASVPYALELGVYYAAQWSLAAAVWSLG